MRVMMNGWNHYYIGFTVKFHTFETAKTKKIF